MRRSNIWLFFGLVSLVEFISALIWDTPLITELWFDIFLDVSVPFASISATLLRLILFWLWLPALIIWFYLRRKEKKSKMLSQV